MSIAGDERGTSPCEVWHRSNVEEPGVSDLLSESCAQGNVTVEVSGENNWDPRLETELRHDGKNKFARALHGLMLGFRAWVAVNDDDNEGN
eukprot:12379987-Alexandrium_andersonii.AAC.1